MSNEVKEVYAFRDSGRARLGDPLPAQRAGSAAIPESVLRGASLGFLMYVARLTGAGTFDV